MATLTYTQLNAVCAAAATPVLVYDPIYSAFLPDLYNIGCRPNELTDQSLWTAVGGGVFELQPLKGNNVRTILEAQMSSYLVEWISGGTQLYDNCTYSKLKQIWKHKNSYNQIFLESKPMDLYLYRYRFVKSLNLAGHTAEEIQTTMGWTNLEMVDTYVNADLVW